MFNLIEQIGLLHAGAVLAKMALTNTSLTASALRCGEFSLNTIIPTFAFYDFETFFSCNNKPVRCRDYRWCGMQNIKVYQMMWYCRLIGQTH